MPPQKEKRRSGDLGRGNDLEKWARKIKANVGDIPPRWVPGIVAALVAIRDFLSQPGTMEQIDAAVVLKQVRGLRLPFERLVRNVWQEGPEVAYDRTKAALQRLLQKEVARRKALALSGPPPPPPKLTTTLGGDEFLLTAPKARPPPLPMNSSNPSGIRTGLLTFAGAAAAHGAKPAHGKAPAAH